MFLSNFLSNLTLSRGNAFIWDSKIKNLKIITHFRFIDLDLLIGIERQKKTIYDNALILSKKAQEIDPDFKTQSFINHIQTALNYKV